MSNEIKFNKKKMWDDVNFLEKCQRNLIVDIKWCLCENISSGKFFFFACRWNFLRGIFFDKCMRFTLLCAFYLILCRKESIKILAFFPIYCTMRKNVKLIKQIKQLNSQVILLRNVIFLNYKAKNNACSLRQEVV